MRTAAKVFIIISLVTSAISLLLSVFPGRTILATLNIASIIVGILALCDLHDDIAPGKGISICTLIFCSLISGILMLVIRNSEVRNDRSYGAKSICNNPQCDKCGKRDLAVRYYTIDSALGRMNRAFCPECKAIFDAENQNKNI